MATDTDIKQWDKRTAARYVARGVVSEKDWEKHLKALPDLADQCVKVETQQPESDRTPTR